MASTYTTSLRIEKPGTGEQSGTWGTTVNTSYDLMEKAVAGYLSIAMADANVTLTTANGSSDQARNAIIELTGTNTATRQCIVPAVSKVYVIKNSTTQSVTVKTSGGTGPTILSGKTSVVFCDGTNVNLVGVAETNAITAISGVTPAADALPYFTGTAAASVTTLTSFARTLLDDTDAITARATLGLTIGTNVQAFSSNLSTYAGITPSANVQSFLGAADYAAMRTQLSLVVGTNVQAYNTGLAAIATVSPAADALPYFTGASTASVTTLTAFARTLLDDPDAATARATLGVTAGGTALQAANNLSDLSSVSTARGNLGLAIGTDVQAFNTGLAAIATVTPAANALPYFTGASTAAVTTLSAFMRTLLDDADAATARATLGLGSLATLSTINNSNWSGTVLAVANGGTGAATASAARTALGVVIGTDVQAYDADLNALATNSTNGLWARTGAGTGSARTLAGTSNEVTVTNGDGVSGNPTISLPATLTFTGKTITDGTFSSPTLSGTVAGSATWSGLQIFNASAHFGGSSYVSFVYTGSVNRVFLDNNGTNFRINRATSTGTYIDSPMYMNISTGVFDFNTAPTIGGVPIVTTTGTQTLSNKTLSSPTLSGTVAGSPTATGTWTFSGSLITILRSGSAPAAVGDESLRVISTGGTNFNTAIGLVSGNAAEARILFGDSDDADIGFITYAHTNNSLIIGTNNANVATFSNTGAFSVIGSITSSGAAVPTISSTDTLSNKTLSSPTVSGTISGSVIASGEWTFRATNSIVYSEGTGGYGSFYARGSGTNPAYMFFGNNTNNERSRILVDNSRNFIISNNDGSTNHFQVGPTGALTASGVAIPTVSSTDTLSNKTLTSPVINGGTIQSRVQTSSETSGTLTSASANKHLALTGNITLNNSVFTADDKMTIDPGTSARTITRGAGCTLYVNGVDSATATVAANQMAGVHVRSASVFVLTGAVS